MINSCPRNTIGLVVFTLSATVLAASARAQQLPPVVEQMAKAYGLDSFGQIEKLRYTWNLEVGAIKIVNSWEWEPKTGQIGYEGKDKDGKPMKLTYRRSELGSQSDAVKNEIDPAFINDQYWLLLPLHVVWDGATLTHEGTQKLSIGKGSAERIVMKYPSEGGYAPGDTWELYVGADHRIEEIIYHGGGPGTQKRPKLLNVTWADHKQAGPLLVSMDHRGTADDKPLRVFLSDVSVKLAGSDGWMNAQ